MPPAGLRDYYKKNDIIFQTVRPYQKNNYFFAQDSNDVVASTGYAQIRTAEDPRFIYHLLHTDKFVTSVLVRSTGTNYPAINSNDLAKIKVALPSKPEQEKIAKFLTLVDDGVVSIEKKNKAAEKIQKRCYAENFFPASSL